MGLLIGRAAWKIRFKQSKALPISGYWHVISIEFLLLSLRRNFAGKNAGGVAKCRPLSQAIQWENSAELWNKLIYRSLNVRETVLRTAVERECTVHPPVYLCTYVSLRCSVFVVFFLFWFIYLIIHYFLGHGFFNGRIINVWSYKWPNSSGTSTSKSPFWQTSERGVISVQR